MSGLFQNRYVRAILLSGLFLQIGIWVRNIAILLYVMERTEGDALAISMISVAEYAPIFLFSFLAGTFVDRWRPKRTMVWSDLISAVSVVAVLLTFVYGTWKAVFFVTLISSILSQFSHPSGMKLFKLHVPAEQLQAGMSLYQTLFAIFMVLGPILGTFVFQTFGMEAAMVITAAAFLLSALVLFFLPPDRVEASSAEPSALWSEMVSGIRYVKQNRVLSLLGLCFMAAGLSIGLVQPLGIFLVTERLGLPKESLQWLITLQGVGMIAGGALTMTLAKTIAPQKLLSAGLLGNAIALAVCGVSTQLWLTLAAQLLSGLLLPCIQIGINTMLLKHTESSFIGRVNGILIPMYTGSMVVTMSVAGMLKEQFSLVSIYMLSSLLFVVGTLFILPLYRMQEGKSVEKREQVG
ncbi:MFS transporter [Brevibacillus choshinensis]|uniref:MFS transporter n=1 Tax=Brevibacillus choshinensis TaxID=54911 RepID=A0ABX7FQJ6_BRECH|nr:MFS transporter [Brevibacillus choshinensis]QRG68003.1 MFS transporter [Brevibacillus choshinensis]